MQTSTNFSSADVVGISEDLSGDYTSVCLLTKHGVLINKVCNQNDLERRGLATKEILPHRLIYGLKLICYS